MKKMVENVIIKDMTSHLFGPQPPKCELSPEEERSKSFIGITEMLALGDPAALPKRELMFFDRIAVLRLHVMWQSLLEFNPESSANLAYLIKAGVAFQPKLGAPISDEERNLVELANFENEMSRNIWPDPLPKGMTREFLAKKQKKNFENYLALITRGASIQMRSAGHDAFPLLTASDLTVGNHKDSEVIKVTIKNLPVPAVDVPLNDILDFKKERESQDKLKQLRRWIKKTAIPDIPTHELEEEIDWLIHSYSQYMKAQGFKFRSSTLEIVLTCFFGMAEDLIKMRLEGLIGRFFALGQEKAKLLEAELSAPGREVSYFLHAASKFK